MAEEETKDTEVDENSDDQITEGEAPKALADESGKINPDVLQSIPVTISVEVGKTSLKIINDYILSSKYLIVWYNSKFSTFNNKNIINQDIIKYNFCFNSNYITKFNIIYNKKNFCNKILQLYHNIKVIPINLNCN